MTLAHVEPAALVPAQPASGGGVSLVDELRLWQECFELAKAIATTPFVPEPIRNNPPAVMATILRGHELGVSAMHSLQQIDFIKGRPVLRAELMRALVVSKGHEIWTEDYTTTRVVLCGQRSGGQHVEKVTWTLDDAKRAKLEGRDNWRLYPKQMLLARATGDLCRLMFADVIAGMSYTLEEVDDGFEELEPPAATNGHTETPATSKRKASNPTAKKRASAARPTVSSGELPPLPGEQETLTPDTQESTPAASDDPPEIVAKRAQAIAIKASEAGVDHHHVVAAVTNGLKTSAKTVTAEEGSQVLEALVKIRQRKLWLHLTGGVPTLTTQEPERAEASPSSAGEETDAREKTGGTASDSAPPDESDSSPAGGARPEIAGDWTEDDWRSFLAEHNVKATTLIAEAQRLARVDDPNDKVPLPTSLDDLRERDALCELLVSHVEELARGGD